MTVTSPSIDSATPTPRSDTDAQGGEPARAPHGGRRGRASMKDLIGPAVRSSLVKLDPRDVARNPVMFVVEIGSVITTIAFIAALAGSGQSALFIGLVSGWLWFTVPVRQLRHSHGRGSRQGPGRHPAPNQDGDARQRRARRRR